MEGDGHVAVRNAIHRLRVTHPGSAAVACGFAYQAGARRLARNYLVTCGGGVYRKELGMMVILLVLLLAVILAGLGFAVHLLWWIALIVLAMWLVGFLVRTTETAGRRRWYRW